MDIATLQKAVDRQQIKPFFQPIFHLQTNQIAGWEVLMRLTIDSSVLSPDKWMPLAERSGLMPAITLYVFSQVVSEASALPGWISFNLDLETLNNANMLLKILNLAAKHPGREIYFEILETAADIRIDHILSLGHGIGIDDFGVGYSNLARVLALCHHGNRLKIKLDISLVEKIRCSRPHFELIHSVTRVFHGWGCSVVGEGIDGVGAKEMIRLLKICRIEYGQGWHWAKAMPLEEAIAFKPSV